MTTLLALSLLIAVIVIVCLLANQSDDPCKTCRHSPVNQFKHVDLCIPLYTSPRLLSDEAYIMSLVAKSNGAGIGGAGNSLSFAGVPTCRIVGTTAMIQDGTQQVSLAEVDGKIQLARISKSGAISGGVAIDKRAFLQALCGIDVIMPYTETHYVEVDDDND